MCGPDSHRAPHAQRGTPCEPGRSEDLQHSIHIHVGPTNTWVFTLAHSCARRSVLSHVTSHERMGSVMAAVLDSPRLLSSVPRLASQQLFLLHEGSIFGFCHSVSRINVTTASPWLHLYGYMSPWPSWLRVCGNAFLEAQCAQHTSLHWSLHTCPVLTS